MEEGQFQTLTAHEALDEARRRIAEAQTAIDTPCSWSRGGPLPPCCTRIDASQISA
jgi:hypothetical protein